MNEKDPDMEDELEDYDMVEGEGDEWMWWYELKEEIKNADKLHVREEEFGAVGDILDVEVDEDGFIRDLETGEYVDPRIPVEVDGSWELVPASSVSHQNPEPQTFVSESLEERMEMDESTPEKLHVHDVYGISIYAGDPAFIYNDFYLGIMMDVSDWAPFIKVDSLYNYECKLCGHEYTNRDFTVPENASAYWVHSCPECGKRHDRSVEQFTRRKKMGLKDARAKAEKLLEEIDP